MSDKFTFITSFFEWHGIGFLDVILQALNDAYEKNQSLPSAEERFNSYEMHKKFSQNGELKHCERVVYLLPKGYKTALGKNPRWKEFLSNEKQKSILASIEKTSCNYEDTKKDLARLNRELKDKERFPEYQWLREYWRHHKDLWHIINDFSIATQMAWYKEHSPIYLQNKDKIKLIPLSINYENLEDEYLTAIALRNWLSEENFNTHAYANLWGSKTSMQIAFHYLSWASPRFKNVKLVKCINEKKGNAERFTPIRIELTKRELLNELSLEDKASEVLSIEQNQAYLWLKKFKEFGDNFTILLLGARGTGKTKLVSDVYCDVYNGKIISVNCAQFQGNPDLARSELFGHIKGAFTGATNDKEGCFLQADKSTLFLDEIHHLDKSTQALLLTALQTDSNGNYCFTPLGSNKAKTAQFQFIAASNKTLEELENMLLPDLLDRISQRILHIPKLKSGKGIVGNFNRVWKEMQFMGAHNPTSSEENFYNWLIDDKREFNGNYRDLEKIAILCADYQRCKTLVGNKSLVKYIESKWQPSKLKEISIENFLDQHSQFSLKEITDEFKAKVVKAAELYSGDIKSAAKMLGITPKNVIEIKKRAK